MSYHSHSSSELEETTRLSDVLPVFFQAFVSDFNFQDVKKRVEHLFTKHELTAILDEKKDERRQTLQLFWVLCAKKELDIERFLTIISDDHKWLAGRVFNERGAKQSKQTEQYLDAVKQLRSHNQKHTDYNVHRLKPYVELRRALKKLKPYHNVVLLSELGAGKKWLAVDVCSDYSVMKAMDFKIFWIDVSQCKSAEQDLNSLQELYSLLLGDTYKTGDSNSSIATRIQSMRHHLKKVFSADNSCKNCLLVLENVQNFKTWEVFNLGCKILLTTRNKKVSDSLTKKLTVHIVLDSKLTLNECHCLFEQYLQRKRDELPPKAMQIYKLSENHPHLLAIIAQNIRQKGVSWDDWIQTLERNEFSKMDIKFNAVIERSLNVLHQHQLKLYATFAIFPYATDIPAKLLAKLWDKTQRDAEDILEEFHRYSLVNKIVNTETNEVICNLTFIYSSHLRESTNIKKLINAKKLHEHVVDFYNLDEALTHRTELDFCNSQHDFYFFNCIGYHLNEAKRTDLIPKLFLDFGFLEQKLRAVGLAHTICDLKLYSAEIINYDHRHHELLTSLYEFLPKVEEKFVHTRDTCLLQYALTATGAVYEEAMRQAEKFPNRVWFTESGSFHQRRQIVNLPNPAKFVSFLDQDLCLCVLDNSDMLLVDISLDCDNSSFVLNNDDKYSRILEARFLRNGNFILTLDDNQGVLKLWAIGDVRRHSLVRKKTRKGDPLNFDQFPEMHPKKSKQTIGKQKQSNIVAFYIEQLPQSSDNATFLHVAFLNGDITIFKWNKDRDEFERSKIPVLSTRIPDIRFFLKVLRNFYMLLSSTGKISFWNVVNSSEESVPMDWPVPNSPLITYELCQTHQNNDTRIVIVFGHKVLCLTLSHTRNQMLASSLETLFECDNVRITCAKLTSDANYLLLGTKHGLIVFDMQTKTEILRSNVSESIVCVDVHALADREFKYVVICSAEKKKVLNILALRQTNTNSICWSHSICSIGNDRGNDPQLEPNVWLLGQKLYDLASDEGQTHLVAVDSKNRIHQVCTTKPKSWTIITPNETAHRITAITAFKKNIYVGYENGAIFQYTNAKSESIGNVINMDKPIRNLQRLDEHTLVAAAADSTKLVNTTTGFQQDYPEFVAKHCYKIFNRFLVLVDQYGIVLILDGSNNFKIIKTLNDIYGFVIGGCDLQDDCLFLATSTYKIYVYNFTKQNDQLNIGPNTMYNLDCSVLGTVTCLTASSDGSLIAVGLLSGDIVVHKVNNDEKKLEHLSLLQSHKMRIFDMHFSPCARVLLTCAEQLCFWNVEHMQNNPLAHKTIKRRSTRFSSQTSNDVEEVDAVRMSPYRQHHLLVLPGGIGGAGVESFVPLATNPWVDKHGPADKPELFACIKFDGNKAEKVFANDDFTEFITIDDEGVYYYLTLLNVSAKETEQLYVTGERRLNADIGDIFDQDVII